MTFLFDANDWPTDSWPFKRTNLIIHLVNGLLLGGLAQQILRALRCPVRDAAWIALVAAAIWLLHPFLVSTTLYAVQRTAQLATLFIFAGLLVYDRARRRVGEDPVPSESSSPRFRSKLMPVPIFPSRSAMSS